jgi:hypothetical protein
MACTETDASDNNIYQKRIFSRYYKRSYCLRISDKNCAHIYYIDLPDVFLVLCTSQTPMYNHLM